MIDRLTQVKGVGVWTAHMFLMFGLRRPDILAVGDLGIRQAIQRAYALPEMPKPAEVERIAAKLASSLQRRLLVSVAKFGVN